MSHRRRCSLTMRSSAPLGETLMISDILSASGRLARRWATKTSNSAADASFP
jgi:hypothetical protein